MAGASSKRVEAETSSNTSTTVRRAKDGSGFARREGCNKTNAKKKPAEKKNSTSNEPKPKRVRTTKEEKKSSSTSNKRPLTAFSIFMNDFRQTYPDKNPYINVKDVAKKGAEKWKSLTEDEKKAYLCKAENNNASEEEEDEEKQSDDVDETEEKEVENTDDDNKGAEGKEEEEESSDEYDTLEANN